MRKPAHPPMDVYFTATPQGRMVTIMLEECGLPYDLKALDLAQGEQFDPALLAVSANQRMPAIVDHETGVHIFESSAILQYLAEKTGRFLPIDPDGKYAVLQWLYWQASSLGPMVEQLAHFSGDAPGGTGAHGYAVSRYQGEYTRLLAVLEHALGHQDYLAAAHYSIADIAIYPWVAQARQLVPDAAPAAGVDRWLETTRHRAGVRRGMDRDVQA